MGWRPDISFTVNDKYNSIIRIMRDRQAFVGFQSINIITIHDIGTHGLVQYYQFRFMYFPIDLTGFHALMKLIGCHSLTLFNCIPSKRSLKIGKKAKSLGSRVFCNLHQQFHRVKIVVFLSRHRNTQCGTIEQVADHFWGQ